MFRCVTKIGELNAIILNKLKHATPSVVRTWEVKMTELSRRRTERTRRPLPVTRREVLLVRQNSVMATKSSNALGHNSDRHAGYKKRGIIC